MIGRTNSSIIGSGGAVPDGATVTPVDDVKTLVKCAGVSSSSYTTIADVLGNDDTMSAITMDENAMKYLARSTGFADEMCANETFMTFLGQSPYVDDTVLNSDIWVSAVCDSTYFEKVLTPLIPIMTSNTTPSGIASCSSVWAGASEFQAWRAFNRVSVSNDMWEADGRTAQWLKYEFPNNVKSYILEIDLSSAYPSDKRYTDSYYLQVSSDGTNWENILTVNPTYDEIVQLTRYKIETPISSKYYRWYFPLGSVQGTYRYTHVTCAQLYGRQNCYYLP